MFIKQTQNILLLFLLCFPFSYFTNCNRTFIYQPTKTQYYNPEKLKLKYKDDYTTGADGNIIHAWYFPSQVNPVKATIVQFHGNAQNISAHFLSLVWLTNHGYNFYTFDYRGYGLSQGEPETTGIIADSLILIKKLQKKSRITKIPIILYGQSLGGTFVPLVWHNLKEREQIIGLVIEGGFHSYKEIASAILNDALFPPMGCLGYTLLSDEYASEKIIPQISPLPLLIIHGIKDTIVPVRFGRKLYTLAKQPKKLIMVPQGGHLINWHAKHNQKHQQRLLKALSHIIK